MMWFRRFFLKRRNKVDLKRKNIEEILGITLRFLPDHSFTKEGLRVDSNGAISNVYVKILDKRCANLFDKIKVYWNDNTNEKRIIFLNEAPISIRKEHLAELVNECNRTYGVDDSYHQRGEFDEIDEVALSKGAWMGRKWTGVQHTPKAILRIDDERLELNVQLI